MRKIVQSCEGTGHSKPFAAECRCIRPAGEVLGDSLGVREGAAASAAVSETVGIFQNGFSKMHRSGFSKMDSPDSIPHTLLYHEV